uniref:Metalloendopeptidase n=1 Tax=Solanum tuberosum TaxID=4113 RepID=M1CPS8_SOLTU
MTTLFKIIIVIRIMISHWRIQVLKTMMGLNRINKLDLRMVPMFKLRVDHLFPVSRW